MVTPATLTSKIVFAVLAPTFFSFKWAYNIVHPGVGVDGYVVAQTLVNDRQAANMHNTAEQITALLFQTVARFLYFTFFLCRICRSCIDECVAFAPLTMAVYGR
jgi:hypothetical protein